MNQAQVKFYATKGKDGNPRFLCVATTDVADGKVELELLGFHPSVAGTSRRGRKPNLDEAVSLDSLIPMEAEDVPEDLQQKAMRVLAPAALPAEEETEDSETVATQTQEQDKGSEKLQVEV